MFHLLHFSHEEGHSGLNARFFRSYLCRNDQPAGFPCQTKSRTAESCKWRTQARRIEAEVLPGCRARPWRRVALKKAETNNSLTRVHTLVDPPTLTRPKQVWTLSVSKAITVT